MIARPSPRALHRGVDQLLHSRRPSVSRLLEAQLARDAVAEAAAVTMLIDVYA
jgi:hypothetical protein